MQWLFKILTGDVLGRLFDTIDRKLDNDTDKERLKAEVTGAWLQNRVMLPWYVDFCFIGPLAFWWAAICLYSIFWHANGLFPQHWTIAALPAPLDEWAGWIVMSRFAVGVVQNFARR